MRKRGGEKEREMGERDEEGLEGEAGNRSFLYTRCQISTTNY